MEIPISPPSPRRSLLIRLPRFQLASVGMFVIPILLGLLLPRLTTSQSTETTAALDERQPPSSPTNASSTDADAFEFEVGTRLFQEFEHGEWFWGEIASVPAPGEGVEYDVAWSDGGRTTATAGEVEAAVRAARTKTLEAGASRSASGKGRGEYRYRSPLISPFDEPREGGDGRPTVKRVRIKSSANSCGEHEDGIEVITPEELYVRYVARSVPVVIEGFWEDYIKDPLFRKGWTSRGIAERWEEYVDLWKEQNPNLWSDNDDIDPSVVQVQHNDDNLFQRIRHFAGEGYRFVFPDNEAMKFSEFVELFEEQERKLKSHEQIDEYVALGTGGLPIFERNDGIDLSFVRFLNDSFPPNPLGDVFDESHLDRINVWVQGRGKVSKLHQDMWDNFLGVLSGSKTLYLVDPKYEGNPVYAGLFPQWTNVRDGPGSYRLEKEREPIQHFSPVDDVLAPDLDRFPRFRHIVEGNHLVRCDLAPGDILFIPSFWWHEVHNHVPAGTYDEGLGSEGGNVAINYWFDPHPMLTSLYEIRRDVFAEHNDWVEDGEELEKEFEMVARRNYAIRQRKLAEEGRNDASEKD
mmetsp:Transcript_28224/g.45884  ORF Transcript_28224/g.45884 Transcript_28224/m.45884 type:complete len:578 (+) Transcript_28224:94-1827(+)